MVTKLRSQACNKALQLQLRIIVFSRNRERAREKDRRGFGFDYVHIGLRVCDTRVVDDFDLLSVVFETTFRIRFQKQKCAKITKTIVDLL